MARFLPSITLHRTRDYNNISLYLFQITVVSVMFEETVCVSSPCDIFSLSLCNLSFSLFPWLGIFGFYLPSRELLGHYSGNPLLAMQDCVKLGNHSNNNNSVIINK